MAEERKGQRVYRRTPADVHEATYIHSLVKKDLESRVLELSQQGELGVLHELLGYEKRWREIVGDISVIQTEAEALMPSPAPAVKRGDEVAPGARAAAGTDASTAEQPNLTPGGGTPRSSRARTNTTA